VVSLVLPDNPGRMEPRDQTERLEIRALRGRMEVWVPRALLDLRARLVPQGPTESPEHLEHLVQLGLKEQREIQVPQDHQDR
jgi:hypothetical protein